MAFRMYAVLAPWKVQSGVKQCNEQYLLLAWTLYLLPRFYGYISNTIDVTAASNIQADGIYPFIHLLMRFHWKYYHNLITVYILRTTTNHTFQNQENLLYQ